MRARAHRTCHVRPRALTTAQIVLPTLQTTLPTASITIPVQTMAEVYDVLALRVRTLMESSPPGKQCVSTQSHARRRSITTQTRHCADVTVLGFPLGGPGY
jgi:hypothetical protein